MTDKEAMKMALEALEKLWLLGDQAGTIAKPTITALKERLAQPEQEPAAVWELFEDGWDSIADPEWMESLPIGTKLYTHPPQRTEQEPVATLEDLEQEIYQNTRNFVSRDVMEWMLKRYYTTPQPQRTWVGLTDEEIKDIELGIEIFGLSVKDVLKEAEAKLKEKNT